MKLTIEKNMRYCLSCQDEYRPEVEKCGVCGAELLTGVELLALEKSKKQKLHQRKGVLSENEDIVTILKASIGDVKRIEQQLAQENIGTLILGNDPSCGKGCCGGGDVELLVRREDAQAAIAIVERDFDLVTAIDSHNTAYVDYGFDSSRDANTCPACGASFSGLVSCPECGLCFG
jgi:hypothetical protein